MMVRREKFDIRHLRIAALLLPLIVGGCMTSPVTYLEWGTRSYHRPVRVTARTTIVPKPRPARYAYEDERPYCSDCDDYADETPSPRPRPAWYQPSQPRPDRPDHSDHAYAAPGTFAWPVRGRVVTEFGSTANGERNDGINIAANYGDPIRAAGDGTVSYSGDDLKSYGNLVLLKHDNGYVTAYAHAQRFIVDKGDRVARGQVIGYVGSTGEVNGPQLHFELRRGSRGEVPINPRPFLGAPQVASR